MSSAYIFRTLVSQLSVIVEVGEVHDIKCVLVPPPCYEERDVFIYELSDDCTNDITTFYHKFKGSPLLTLYFIVK